MLIVSQRHLEAVLGEYCAHYLQPVLGDESEYGSALRWVSLVAEDAGLKVEELQKSVNQPTPSATIWLLRYKAI
jgi:hypothetical protein